MINTRTQTVEEPRPSISNRDQQTREQTPTVEDQIRGYRLGQRMRHELTRRLPRRSQGYNRTLESQMDPDAELNISQFRRAQSVPAEVLYQAGGLTTQHQVYQHYSDQRILVVGSQQLEVPFITQQGFERLQRSGLQHLHIGLIMIRLFTLHRRAAGVNALVVIRDTRWSDDLSIIGTMEMDLTHDTQLAYIAPNMMLSISDFYNHIQLVIQTHGYDTWRSGESNLLLTRSLIGRLSNTSYTGFRYNVTNVSDYLTSRGVQVIPGQQYTAQELRGRLWTIRPPRTPEIQNPQEAVTEVRTDGSILLRFRNYGATPTPQQITRGEFDEEQLEEEEIVAMAIVDGYETDQEEEEENETDDYLASLTIMSQKIHIEKDSQSQPIWDDYQDDDEEMDFINPFAEGGGGYPKPQNENSETAFVAKDEEMEYPKLKQMMKIAKKEKALSSVTSTGNYRPPTEPLMGPVQYPPGRMNTGASTSQQPFQQWRKPRGLTGGIGHHQNAQWNLPTAMQTQGAMLVLPEDIGLYNDVISRWESITLNLLSEKNFDDNKAKVLYIENLLGEIEKKIWIQWRMACPEEYETLVNIADDPQNVLSQIRRVLLLEDPYQGTTDEQDRAYQDLERLSCDNVKDLFFYMNDFKVLAAKSGRMYISTELSSKFFRKMPPIIGKELEQAFQQKFPGNNMGVIPRIHFSYQYLADMCKKAAFQRSLKDLTICNRIPIPGEYYNNRKKYGLRKAKTYKGKPHDSHVQVFKRKHADRVRKCKCFICGEEGHFARDCKRNRGNIARAAILDNLDLPDDIDVVSVDLNEPDSDAICSLSEGEVGTEVYVRTAVEELPWETSMMLTIEDYGWRNKVNLSAEQETCTHELEEEVQTQGSCSFCKIPTNKDYRIGCNKCGLLACPLCAPFYLGKPINLKKRIQPKPYTNKDNLIKELMNYIEYLENENERLRKLLSDETQEKLGDELAQDLEKLTIHDKGKKKLIEETDEEEADEEITVNANVVFLDYSAYKVEETKAESSHHRYRKIDNKLYNMVVTMDIPGIKQFDIRAILDTGASTCCVCQTAVPEDAIESSDTTVQITGVNSKQIVNKKLKGGQIIIGENRFRIPYTYCFPMGMKEGIQMLIGCNFIHAMKGGLRIEGKTITFYKNVTEIQTSTETIAVPAAIEELDLDEYEYIFLQDALSYQPLEINHKFEQQFNPLLTRLKEQGYIGSNPLQYWSKNRVVCKLDIINPDITIEDKPLKHVTPAMKEQFERHVKALLEIGVIRPSTSRHRTMAFIVNSGTSIDPKTGKEVKGKERMVLNYRSLNDNTHKDQYSLPGINTIIKKIGNSKVFSKFDLKSGFHQVAMDPESIPWTAFIVPGGLYEWLVMPFGLKNAPAIFQRKMDNCFRGTEAFIAVYIDDILIFSQNEKEHKEHLETMLAICEKNGLVLSPTKMKIAVPEIEFLGAIIGNQKIKLQSHIIKRIVDFQEKDLKEKKGLRSWLGILNYARSYIPKLGTLLGPLYSKTAPHGDKRMKNSDWELIRKIKKEIQNLPDLELPPVDSYIILETDGCMEGWGGVCKWKKIQIRPKINRKSLRVL